MSNLFLFVTANKYEKSAFENKFISESKDFIKGKSYKIGKLGLYNVAHIHIDEQGYTNPASIPLVGELAKIINPIAVIMVGIAFGVDEYKQAIGDVLVSKKILPYDTERIKESSNEYKEDSKETGFQLFNAFSDSDDWDYYIGSKRATVYKGAILTGSKLINNYEFRNKLLTDFKSYQPIGGEMESYGVYSLCRLHGITEWIIVKAICDWAYHKDLCKDKYQKIASESAVDYCYYIFSQKGVFGSLIESGTVADLNPTIPLDHEPKQFNALPSTPAQPGSMIVSGNTVNAMFVAQTLTISEGGIHFGGKKQA
ncbi:MAG: hypothetical protein FWG87_10255 [Defluviitaleaceae bacterium]|nr:hypothetical protein [Defluviitaleaceae bacterium]